MRSSEGSVLKDRVWGVVEKAVGDAARYGSETRMEAGMEGVSDGARYRGETPPRS